MIKRGKQEQYLREILAAIISRYNTQVSWNSLASELSIDHPNTVADYVRLLERMDAIIVQSALLEDKLTAAPKKAKKLMFCDPFILHAIRAWIEPVRDPFNDQILALSQDPVWASKVVEACVTSHFHRFYPTYYIKAQAEVDIAYVYERRFWPIEIKWTSQLRPKALKQIGKYANGEIWTRSRQSGEINGIKTSPLPIQLLRVGASV
jgi:predicted AAA+ superfamily ATPase